MEIDKDIPVPTDLKGGSVKGSKRDRYPWDKLEIGDSFLITLLKQGSVRHSVTRMNRLKSPKKFVCREAEEGIRVWRLK